MSKEIEPVEIGSKEWLDDILGRVWCRDMSADEAAVELSWFTGEIESLTDQNIDLKWALTRLLEACNPDQLESAEKDAKQVLKECE